MLSIIVAKAKNNIIGKNNRLLWSLPEDLKRFKELTTGHIIIMGRKTFDSLGRVLPNRKHIVFTQNPDFKIDNENVEVVHSMLEIKEYIDDENENFVIGGAMIYNLLLPYTKKIYVTDLAIPLHSRQNRHYMRLKPLTSVFTIDIRQPRINLRFKEEGCFRECNGR